MEQGVQRFGVSVPLDSFDAQNFSWRVRLLERLQRFTVRSARLVIAPSGYMREKILSWGVDPTRAVLVYNGIELPVPIHAPDRRPDGFLIVSIGRLVPWKGIDGIIRVLAREKSWRLLVVGDGPQLRRLQLLAEKLGVTRRVEFLGALPRSEALGWASVADTCVLNSTYEGLSHLLIEIMSLGKAIVATRVGGNSEVIVDNASGILIPPGNDDALHRALTMIHDSPETARSFGEEARQRAQDFSIEKTAAATAALLHTL